MKKVILAILDGVGYSEKIKGNALRNADTPFLDSLLCNYPYSFLDASGNAVGLPAEQMGNSEVGHLTIGAGRTVYQSLERINNYIKDDGFVNNDVLNDVFNHVKDNNSKLHLCGLLSDGGVHSHINHLFSLLDACKKSGIKDVYIHVILDGRDTFSACSMKYLDELDSYISSNKIGKLSSISGRFYAMDRENIWDRTKAYYDTLVYGSNEICTDYKSFIETNYKNGITDEFIPPVIVNRDGIVSDNDGFVVFNFRPDRLVQLCEAFTLSDFSSFDTKKFSNLKFVTMMPVSNNLSIPYLLPHEVVNDTLGEVLSSYGLRVLRIAEDAKFPHVTHFFDGDKDVLLPLTDRIKVPRKNVLTYDLAPEMSSKEIVDIIGEKINLYDFICVNFANGDMVGHTGNYNAGLIAVQTLDYCIERLKRIADDNGFTLLITADHGNCEEMIGPNGEALTTHTTNKVYFIVCDDNYEVIDGSLSNIAPSILKIMDINIPSVMEKPILFSSTR